MKYFEISHSVDSKSTDPDNTYHPLRVYQATDFLERLRGLIGRRELGDDEMFWIPRCQSVHTFGMRFNIAVHFLDASLNIMRSYACVRPGRLLVCYKAESVVEMAAVEGDQDLARQRRLLARMLETFSARASAD